MYSLDFNVPYKGLRGETSGQTLSDILAELLASEMKGNARKLGGWMYLLAANKPLLVDKSDKKLLEEIIETTERIAVLVKVQLLDILDSVETV